MGHQRGWHCPRMGDRRSPPGREKREGRHWYVKPGPAHQGQAPPTRVKGTEGAGVTRHTDGGGGKITELKI